MPRINGNISTSTFQSMDGSNFTVSGLDVKTPYGLGAFAGMATDFSNPMGVFDVKESNPYKKGSIISQNLRIRTKFGKDLLTTQVRFSPFTANIPLGKTTTAYVNPHYVGQYDYNSKTWKNSAGIFGGVTQQFGDKVSVSLEGQRYNLQDFHDNSGANWSVNAIVSVKIF